MMNIKQASVFILCVAIAPIAGALIAVLGIKYSWSWWTMGFFALLTVTAIVFVSDYFIEKFKGGDA